jgi:uncharacterized protein YndB with AHSA1/START domain
MPVKKHKDGHRSVEAEVEVPGSPEEVWRAIATGDGISSWFVPSTVEEREGGKAVCDFGPGMEAVSTITTWNPPHNYIAEAGEGPEKIATEWIVEARRGGTCLVRVVHRWFADNDDWDTEFEGHAYGWATSYFRMLWIYLTHFPGQRCSPLQFTAMSSTGNADTWWTIRTAVKIDRESRRAESTPGSPELAGVLEDLEVTDPELLRIRAESPQIVAALEGMGDEWPELLVRLERPAPGLAHVFTMAMGEQTMVSLRLFLYGDPGAAAAPDVEREWPRWLAEQFPQEVSA